MSKLIDALKMAHDVLGRELALSKMMDADYDEETKAAFIAIDSAITEEESKQCVKPSSAIP